MIRPLAADDAQACDAIIAGLPEWFGLDEGIAECAAAVRIQRGLVAEADEAVVGFVTHRLHYPQAGELVRHRDVGDGEAIARAKWLWSNREAGA